MKMDKIKVIFFDAYGTLFSTGTGSVDAAREILALRCRRDIDPAAFYARWKQIHRQAMREPQFVSERDIFAADLARLYGEYAICGDPAADVETMLRSLLDRRSFPETAEVLYALSRRFRIVIASNTDTAPLMQNLEYNRLRVDEVHTSESLGCYKPSPLFYARLLERTRVQPREALFVGDSPEEDALAPAAAGMHSVLIDRRNFHPDHPGRRICDL